MGRRSVWAWGYEDELPSGPELDELAARVEPLIGARPSARHPSPPRVPQPRCPVPGALADFATQDERERAMHTYGKAWPDLVRAFAGDFSPAPDFVLLPRTEADVALALSTCADERVAVIPFGGGTSVVGGVEAAGLGDFSGVASLDLRRMDRLLEVDEVSMVAHVQAGATGPRLEEQLHKHGLTLRHFPQSFEFSTVGGWIATRAGGHFATLYTHIDDLVHAVRMVTPTGPWQTPQVPSYGGGPSPTGLVLGSEGTLGVITEAHLRVQPRPTFRAASDVRFARFADAVAACRAVAQARLYPANCRLLDAGEALLNRVADDGSCVLLLAFESADHPVDAPLARALELCSAHSGDAREPRRPETGPEDAAAWRASFLRAPYLQSALLTLGVMADTFETCCRWSAFDRLYERVSTEVGQALKEACGGGALTCRLTHVYPDGPAPYFTFVAPTRPGEELERWSIVKSAAAEALVAEGAAITHHHAVGRTHRPYFARQTSPTFLAALRGAKQAVDPTGILNPGALIPPP
jgi:alkyldihydroxyacetonephosphate synthase